jgi:hypothetical protein
MESIFRSSIRIKIVQAVVRQVVRALGLFRRGGVVHLGINRVNLVLADLYSLRIKAIDFASGRIVGDPFGLKKSYCWYRLDLKRICGRSE